MNKAPQVGDRVRYQPPNTNYGMRMPVDGKVIAIFPNERAKDDQDWNSPTAPPWIGMAPETEWGVLVEVDEIPAWWPYAKDIKQFWPNVVDLEPCKNT